MTPNRYATKEIFERESQRAMLNWTDYEIQFRLTADPEKLTKNEFRVYWLTRFIPPVELSHLLKFNIKTIIEHELRAAWVIESSQFVGHSLPPMTLRAWFEIRLQHPILAPTKQRSNFATRSPESNPSFASRRGQETKPKASTIASPSNSCHTEV